LELAQIRAERERRVRNITDKIRQSPDRETILRVAREEVGHILKASNSVAGVGTQAQLLSKLGQQTETDETDQVDDRAS
jgi:GAF domain-containing protein